MTGPARRPEESGVCRYAVERPAYVDFHGECRGTFEVTVSGPGGGTVSGNCGCFCHTGRSGEAER